GRVAGVLRGGLAGDDHGREASGMSAIGLEMSLDTERAAVVRASPREDAGAGCFHLTVLFYGPAVEAAFCVPGEQLVGHPRPNAGRLPGLRKAGCWRRLVEAVDVAAASYEFKAAVRARRVTADEHPALAEAMKYAVRRPLAAAFAFDRRRAAADQSVLNAAAF